MHFLALAILICALANAEQVESGGMRSIIRRHPDNSFSVTPSPPSFGHCAEGLAPACCSRGPPAPGVGLAFGCATIPKTFKTIEEEWNWLKLNCYERRKLLIFCCRLIIEKPYGTGIRCNPPPGIPDSIPQMFPENFTPPKDRHIPPKAPTYEQKRPQGPPRDEEQKLCPVDVQPKAERGIEDGSVATGVECEGRKSTASEQDPSLEVTSQVTQDPFTPNDVKPRLE